MAILTGDIPAKRKLKVGMVGGGKGAFFASYHRAAMRLCDRFEIVAGAFSSDPATGREAGEALGVDATRIYSTFELMALGEKARPDPIEAVVIVTPNFLHFEPCRLFLEAGIPVICDKPLVNSLDEALELLRIARQRDTFLAMTYTYLGYPMVRDARSRIQGGELGEIRFLYVEYLLEWLAPGVEHLGKSLAWRGEPAKAGPTAALGDVGTHAFNMLEFLSGRRCTGVNAKLTSTVPGWAMDDTNVVQLEFEGGVDGLLWASLAAPGHRNGLRFKVIGSKASIEWCQEAPETLRFTPTGEAERIYRRGQSDNCAQTLAFTSLPAGNSEGYLEALAVLYADFAQALEAGSAWRSATVVPIPDIQEGARGVALSQACVESNRRRGWVPFPQV
ncbi:MULTISPECIES: Gfo/Idh/MocA family oxidoreductase [unclassified Pseudomonas]|uniref:Gfo/Idh/MocA family protein n=1 Tax=unclassified Pseudomonas TaxID=196821 RepID=UPI00128B309D|nr:MULTISPECIES: Gfo/Idh/MocA family oxidoreductase [unclassified Pseudomonas]MPQ67961.1 gfo/Idh/MocA family oxidoreductase [Pseudomonas sp. MWU12-2323]